MFKRLLLFLLVLVSQLNGFSQQFSFNYLGDKQGISVDQITRIAQDAGGYMWIDTDKGLYRWDGTEFINLADLIKHPDNLGTCLISSICVASDSNLYLTSQGTLFCFNYKRGEVNRVKLQGTNRCALCLRQGVVKSAGRSLWRNLKLLGFQTKRKQSLLLRKFRIEN